ncbi:MAG TPA: metallophosphoesterase [Vicinamibacterales bacterium]|nr:metallophosphoesterase [Vicinamibacterales bacterium]
MPEFHAEPYIYLPAVSHKSALIAWGAFYFRTNLRGKWKIVDDDELKYVHPPRKDSIGAQSAPYGPAQVEVYDRGGRTVACAKTEVANHCWLTGLQPDTEYTYKVIVKGEEWASGERWDWSPREHALTQSGGRYDNRFRTNPDPLTPAASLTFAAIGDFGVGVRRDSPTRKQLQVAYALRKMVDLEDVRFLLTTGDNIYATSRVLGVAIGETGDEDDDWFFTYFQPYRYVINRIPVYPSIGNHDADETEEHDDRGQVEDNFYLRERMASEEAAGRASFSPGLFYRFRYGSEIEFVCIDTSKETFFRGYRLFEFPKHWDFVEQSFPAEGPHPAWRIPFAHHPLYSAGPRHHNTRGMEKLLPLFERSGVRVMFAGHEHNFQHSRSARLDHFVTGAAGKVRRAKPDGFGPAYTQSWSTACHFLLGHIEGRSMTVRAIGTIDEPSASPGDIERFDTRGHPVTGAIQIHLD